MLATGKPRLQHLCLILSLIVNELQHRWQQISAGSHLNKHQLSLAPCDSTQQLDLIWLLKRNIILSSATDVWSETPGKIKISEPFYFKI